MKDILNQLMIREKISERLTITEFMMVISLLVQKESLRGLIAGLKMNTNVMMIKLEDF